MPLFDFHMFFNQLFWTLITFSWCLYVVEFTLIQYIYGRWFYYCIMLKKLEIKAAQNKL
jgi:hypothetical protein